MRMLATAAAGIALVLAQGGVAQPAADFGAEAGFQAAPAPADHVTEEDRREIWRGIDASLARLALPVAKAGERPVLSWPIRAARGFAHPAAWRIVNYVDNNPAFPDQLRDYTCGAQTYDRADGYNHQGTDISLIGDAWNLMAARQIEVVAAAPGVIVNKMDGRFDRQCAVAASLPWNAVYVQHDDGSIAWYGHLTNASLTPKAVGERVVTGEYLGLVGSSGNSTGPHLHFELYDAERRLVDPFGGACNGRGADSWWERQPPYRDTTIVSVTIASAPPVAPTCAGDGRLQSAGSFNGQTAFARGARVWLVAVASEIPVGSSIRWTIREPGGTVVAEVNGATATELFPASYWWNALDLGTTAPLGTWMAEARIGTSSTQVPFTVTADGSPIPNYTDLWFNPSESGWGLNINHQGSTAFATWFTYDTDGAGLWLVMPSGAATSDGGFEGALYRTTGIPFGQINGAPSSTGTPAQVGTGRLRFPDANSAIFSYTVNGVAQQKTLQRQRFGTAPSCMQTRAGRASSTNYQDLWWNEPETGWGINIAHQGDILFATWFTYGAGGRGMWLVAPETRRTATGEYRGPLFRTTGIPFDRIAGAPALSGTPVQVGEVTLSFSDGETGRLAYTVEGTSQAKAITRQVFAPGAPLCR